MAFLINIIRKRVFNGFSDLLWLLMSLFIPWQNLLVGGCLLVLEWSSGFWVDLTWKHSHSSFCMCKGESNFFGK